MCSIPVLYVPSDVAKTPERPESFADSSFSSQRPLPRAAHTSGEIKISASMPSSPGRGWSSEKPEQPVERVSAVGRLDLREFRDRALHLDEVSGLCVPQVQQHVAVPSRGVGLLVLVEPVFDPHDLPLRRPVRALRAQAKIPPSCLIIFHHRFHFVKYWSKCLSL